MTPDLKWDGTSLEDYFFKALTLSKQDHRSVIRLREWNPKAWERALRRFEYKNRTIPEFIEKGDE